MKTRRPIFGIALWLSLAAMGFAQERAGEAQLGFQQYYLTNGSQRVSNAMGLTLGFRELFPRIGVVTVNLAPATNNGRFQTGTSFGELKQLPWLGQYWTFRGGDFRLAGRLIEVPFNNLFYPDIAGRGGLIEATHGGRTVGAFYGSGTLQSGNPRPASPSNASNHLRWLLPPEGRRPFGRGRATHTDEDQSHQD